MRILITGARGMLGRAVLRACKARHLTVAATDLPECDITRLSDLRVWTHEPLSAVINCAAFTAVDEAESRRELALAVNRDGPRFLVQALRPLGVPLVHISTDYVFNGTKDGAWEEEDPTDPINFYGRSKLDGEREVLDYELGTVIRTSWLFGHGGKNFVDTIAGKLRAGETLDVVDDQHGRPTSTPALAQAILKLLRVGGRGLFHFCQPPTTTWCGLARVIAQVLDLPAERIHPTTTDRFPRPAKRPVNSVLSTAKYSRITGRPIPPWVENLKEHLKTPS